ncbi:hypothetical protein LAZ40_06630 [Cereibacter sphaeroides]|uniref:hypothetical protein n=1 Tax=Cereibacter sphaeroides TaxID=1063 RepID=UPI001F338FEF|nr:hypothetical protein [Cereibacter sphaeroides]MCE6958721.1 hypothetical protein [Cereibacter sphaeroides]MCE6971209.1 hypothetical protein [Cereibacter sphaeroides]
MHLSRRHWSPEGRTLDSFADDIICQRSGDRNAVLDCGFLDNISDPDFAPYGYGADFAEAARNCAQWIRADARGIGKYAPHRCLTGYDLHYRLMPHWDRKERFKALGLDPNEVIRECRDAFGDWPFKGDLLTRVTAAPHAEFFFKLLVATQEHAITSGASTPEEAHAAILAELEDELDGSRSRINDAIRARVAERLNDLIPAPQPANTPDP